MESNKIYKGVVVPAVTPLTANHQLDEAAVERLFALLDAADAQPFILGTTGEAASLPLEVKKDYITRAGMLATGRGHLYAGISSNVLSESIWLSKFCADAGIDVVVATLPAYYALTGHEVIKYFETLADESALPVIIYNIPATTHVSLPLKWVDQLSAHPNIVGAKDSERDEERLKESISKWKNREDFSHFVGWAAQSAAALLAGSDGIIPSTGNLAPGIYQEMLAAVSAGKNEEAFQWQKISDDLGAIYQKDKTLGQSLWALKVLMQHKDICSPIMMPPLQEMDDRFAAELIESFTKMKLTI